MQLLHWSMSPTNQRCVTQEIVSVLKSINASVQMFNYATIKQLLLLQSDRCERLSKSCTAFRIIHFLPQVSNMNIGAWPAERDEFTDCHVQSQELLARDANPLCWTRSFLQTTPYDEKRYRQIASNACKRIVHEESGIALSRHSSCRVSSTIAISLSQTSTQRTSPNQQSAPPTAISSATPNKAWSHTRFSCYLTPQQAKARTQPTKKVPAVKSTSKNNNQQYARAKPAPAKRKIIRLTHRSREQLCSQCLNTVRSSSAGVSSRVLCQSCLGIVRKPENPIVTKRNGLSRREENELRQIIEVVIEEFQDHFGHALSLSIKQMTQHLLSNINLFYRHYQQEFEQLTKKYRLAFLERFIQLMNKFQASTAVTSSVERKLKSAISEQKSITHPPNILPMSSLSSSLLVDRDRSDGTAHVTTPSNSASLSTASNRSILISERASVSRDRKPRSMKTPPSKPKQPLASSLQLIDAYRFRDTLKANNAHFAPLRPKIR